MKVLFLSSGNSKDFTITPFIKSQGESLKKNGVHLNYFLIKGKGLFGYLKNIKYLRDHLKSNKYDVIHAHYSLVGWVAVLSTIKIPIVVSFMGCDTYGDYDENGKLVLSSYFQIFLSKLLQPFVAAIIVKSKNLEEYVYKKNKLSIIPNGVNFEIFKSIEQKYAKKYLGLDLDKKYVLFLGDKNNKRKNYNLANDSMRYCNKKSSLINPYPIEHSQIPLYLNACDCLIMTSYNEGSPNTIKEAMACSCPIVSTDIGDVKEIIGNTEGCYISQFDSKSLAEKIDLAILFNKRTEGRSAIKHLDENKIASKLIAVYNNCIK